MSIEDKIFKAQQKADALTDSFTDNDPILARSEALKNKLVFDQLAKMSNPRVSLVDKLYSMGETQQRIQGIEEQEKAYKINKIADPTRYDNSYVDQKTGEVKKYSDLINYDREIEDYSLWGATKTAATRGTAELLQGTGKGLQWLTNQTGKGLETAGTLLGDITNSLLTGEKIYADKYNEINKKWDNNTIGALGVTNAIAKPLNEAAKKINYKNLSSTDDIHQAFSEGLLEGGKELGSAIAHTLIGSAPEVAPALFGVVPGLVAGAGSFMARVDKERQAKALGVSPDDIMEVSPNMTPEDLIGGAIYGGLNLIDAGILKNAIGKGMISKLSDDTIGLSSKADNATKNAFAKLRESNPSLDAWLKPEGVGAKALAWTGDKAWKLGKTTGKVGGKIGIAAGLEGGTEMGQTLMEQWANGDLKNRSWDKNWEDIKEAGLMGAYVGGALKAPHAVYQEGKGKLESAFNSKKETKALEKYTPAANKALAGGNTLFDKLDDEKFGENLSKEDTENYKADFNDIINSSPDASIDDINNFLNDENNRDAVIKTIYLAKNGKLGSDAAKSIVESHNNLVNTILSDSNPNEAILNSKSILEKIMYAVNLRDTNFVRGLFNSAISKSNKDVLNSPENASNEVAKTLETYIAIMENLRDTLSKGIEQTKSLLGNIYSETKDKASLAYMNKMINTVKKTPTQVGMEIIKSGFTTMDGNKKESVSDYMDFLNKTNDIDALRNKKTKLETYRNNHRAKVTLYQFLKNSKPIKQDNIAVIPRFSTNPNDIRVMSKQEFENELKRINTPRNHFTIFESRFSNPKSYQTSVENLLNSIQNELDIMEQTYNDYEYKINKVSKQNTQNTTDNSSNKQESKSNEKAKQSSTQSKQESKESETTSENKKSSNDNVTQEERIKQEKVKLSNQENTNIDDDTPPFDPDPKPNNTNIDDDTPPFDPDPKPSEVKSEVKPEQTIDIYFTNQDKWSYLTNVTKLKSPLVLNIGGQEYKFVSVEHAYQSLKHNDFSKPMSEWTLAEVYKANWNNAIKIRSELKENRENDSNIKIMKYLLEERVKQDSKFKKLLKETGNATLTHNKDNTIWKDKFPELLMEIRNELDNKNEQEVIPSSNVEQEVSNQNTIANIVNFVKPKTIEKYTLTLMFNKLKEIKNGNELIKKVLTYGKALSNFIKENKNSKSQIATMGDIREIANKINKEFSSIKQRFFDLFFIAIRGNKNNGGNLPGILGEIQDNYANKNNIYNTPTELFQLNNYTSVKIKEPKNGTPFAEISTAPAATLLHDNRTVLSMAIRGIETLTTLQFNKSRYMNNEEMTEHLQKVFGKDLDVNLEYPVLKTLNEYSLENSLLLDIGRNIIKDLGLEFNQDTTGKEQESFIAQELGTYTINALEKIGFIDRTSLKNSDIFTDSEKPLARLNLIKIKDDVFSKDATNENSTKNILEKLTNICEELKIDRNQSRVAYKFSKGFGKLDNREHKTTKGKLKKLYKKAAKSLQISRNTKFVAKSRGYLLDFFERNNITLDTINKASEGYTTNLDSKLEKLKDNFNKLNETDTILLSEIENKKGKNLGIENENSYMWDIIHDERSESEGVFFDFRLSKNEREFMQSDGINPQSQKISRFLLVPEALFTTYTKGKNGEILYKGKEDNIAYQHIAQAFGMGTDKAARADSIAFGKSIVALDFNKLEKTMAEAMKKGKIEFEVDGIELSIAELGHALSALSALSKFYNAKAGENFEAAILGEADGINNGIAIKLLQYMLHPQYIELLRGTGIDFVKQVSDKISDYFAGKVDGEEILDLYQTVAKEFNKAIDENARAKDATRISTLRNLKDNDKKLAYLINEKNKNGEENKKAVENIVDNVTDSLVDIFKKTDDDKVSKSSRNATKPIVQVFGYGAGDESQINGLISSLMEKVERGALDYINGKSKNDFYYNILHGVYYLVTRKNASPDDIKNALIHGIEVKKQNSDEKYTTTLLSAKIEGTSVNGYYIIKSILKEQLQSTIKNTMMSTFPGIREQSQLINEITNQRISLVQKMFERKKEEKLKNLKEKGALRNYLTIKELKEIQDELRKDLPGITLSIAEKDELDDIEAKHYFENIKEKTSETTGSQIFLKSGTGKESKQSLTINPKENVYLDNGAGTNVIAIHQKDGSTILLAVVETAKKNEKGKPIRTFLGVHDAVVVGSHNAIEIQQTMNRIALEMDMKSRQLEEFEDIAKKNIEIAKKLGEKNIIVLETMAQIQEIFATISNFNRIMLGNYSVSYNNIQNGNEGSAYTNIVENALNPEIKGQDFNSTLIDFSFISSRLDDRLSNVQLPELLDLFNSNKMIIQRLSNKKTLSENDAKKLVKALVAMEEVSSGLKEYKKKLDKVIDEKLDNLGSIQTNTKNKVDNDIEIPFNTKYKNVINAITRAINKNNIEGIKEAYEAVNSNEKGFRTAINKYLNSLDNMSESYKTNFKNKIKEALNIDIDKKLSGSKKAREEIEENITDENLKEALNKEIDNIEQTELINSTNDEFKDFKQSNNVLNSPENKNNKNKLNSVENTEQNNNDTETTAIPILDDIQNNPNAISEMQDNLRDLDKQNGRSIDEEHSNILKEVLNKITDTLSQSVGDLKVLLSNTNATNNAGEYNREINAITIKHSTNPRYSGYMGAELTYAHEMIHAATSFAVRYMQGNNKFTHMLRTAYELFLHNANAETIAEHLTQIPNIQERHRIANMLFNHMTKNEDSLTNLEEFLAIALTDKAMIEILQSIPYKEESKTLFQKIRDSFFEIFDTIFGDNILKVKKNASTYDMLVSLAAQMGKINQNAKNEVTKNKSKLREIINFAREEMDEKLSEVISTSLTPIKKFLVKEMVTNTSDSWLGHIRYHAASGVLAMCSKDYQDNLRKELSDTYIALNNDTMLGAIIDDISTPSAMARLAQRAQRESSRIDAKRESYEYFTEQTLKKFFKNPISEYEAQAMGEVLLDMDIASLNMDINDIQSLLSNEAMLNDKIKEFKNKINSKNLDQKYKNYIHNRSIALAYKMVTGKNIDNAVALNAYNIVNCVGTNNRYGNPSTKYNKEFKNELVKDVDQYITLLALKLMDKGTKESVANVINKDLEATEKVMNFIKNFNKNSQKDLFKDNKIQTIKGYRRDVYNNDKEIIWADASREKELAKEGYKRISKPLLKNASDNTNDTRYMYVNTFISKQTNFTRQAIRYTEGISRGHELRDLINHEIYENPERVNELERLYHKSMTEAKENFKRDISKAMNIEIPLDIKILEGMSKETNLQPILDEVGNVASFSYQMSKEVKKDVLALNTNIFKSLGKMQANYYDKNASRDLNNRIVEILVNDYKVASKNPLELDKMFIELSHDTKDPLKREIYKMLDYETRTKLEKEMGGKIMIRKDTFAKFFGVRDMDVRNAKWFKKMSNVEVKKTIIFTAELLKMITKLFKLETVVRTPSVFIANQVSNIWQCMNYGIPLLDSLKLHREAVANLRRYQEGKRKLIELELKVSAGEKVNEASINTLRTSLKNNPVYPLVAHGFLNTIIEDLDKPAKGYFEEKYSEFYNNRSSVGKGIIDWAFLTEKTWLGKGLTEYVHMADFLSRYTLYYGLKNQGKLNETQIIDEVSDAFIDYDMITNRGIKMLNDYGFALFTRFFTRSQRLIKNHFVDRPFTTAALLVTQFHVGDAFNDSVYDTVFWNKNYDYMLGLANPIYNAIDVLSPSGLKFVPGMSDVMSTANLRNSSMFI